MSAGFTQNKARWRVCRHREEYIARDFIISLVLHGESKTSLGFEIWNKSVFVHLGGVYVKVNKARGQ